MTKRIYLSPPDVGEEEGSAVIAALESGWVAPLGPEVDAFEADIAAFCGVPYAVALASGTAALHLGLLALGVQPGDVVVVPTLTFGATAFAVTYTGALPVFVDSEMHSWNMDPDLLEEYLARSSRRGRLPAAVVPVDVFGRTADYDRILPLCAHYGVPVLADAAESLGSRHHGSAAGSMGEAAAISFNGNKIITTSGGGMLITHDGDLAHRARHLATQARQSVPWYEHEEVGYNYRMSNILAALGRAQLRRLPDIVKRRREIRSRYARRLSGVPGIAVVGDAPWGSSNSWLTTVLFAEGGPEPDEVLKSLWSEDIEGRHVWKPMHMQPAFADMQTLGGAVAEQLFARAVCLPSGNRLPDDTVDAIADRIIALTAR